MTDPISAQITINARRGGYGQSGGRLIMTMADHIDAQDATIKALTDALDVVVQELRDMANSLEQTPPTHAPSLTTVSVELSELAYCTSLAVAKETAR